MSTLPHGLTVSQPARKPVQKSLYQQVAAALGMPLDEAFDIDRHRGQKLERQGRLLLIIGRLFIQHTLDWQLGRKDGPFREAELEAAMPIFQEQVLNVSYAEVLALFHSNLGGDEQ